MPFFAAANQVGGKLITKSSVVQGKLGNCYIAAAIAAYSLCPKKQPAPSIEDVIKEVSYGMGGTSKRAFEAMGLCAFSPVTLGISWSTWLAFRAHACLDVPSAHSNGDPDLPTLELLWRF